MDIDRQDQPNESSLYWVLSFSHLLNFPLIGCLYCEQGSAKLLFKLKIGRILLFPNGFFKVS